MELVITTLHALRFIMTFFMLHRVQKKDLVFRK